MKNFDKKSNIKRSADEGGAESVIGIAAGSVTVEVSLIFPFFLVCVWVFFKLFIMLFFEINIINGMQNAVNEISNIGYIYRTEKGKDLDNLTCCMLPFVYGNLADAYDCSDGNVYVKIEKTDDGEFKITVTGNFDIDAPFFDLISIPIKNSFLISGNVGTWDENVFTKRTDESDKDSCGNKDKTQNGNDGENGSNDEKDSGNNSDLSDENSGNCENYYVTETATVYHKSLACRYLNAKYEAISESKITGKRNKEGKKYYACTLCDTANHTGIVYITESGEKYHYSALCTALKRNYKCVTKDEIKGKKACSVCGK